MLKRLRVTVLALSVSCVLAGATTASRLFGTQTADSPVADAAMRGDTAGVRTLLRGGADVNAAQGDGMTALHWTALNGDLKTMNVLLYAGAATEALTRVGAYTPLHLASSRGHAAAVARLLEAGSKAGPSRRPACSRCIWRHRPATRKRSRRCSIAAPTSTRRTRRTAGRRSSSRRRRIGSTP